MATFVEITPDAFNEGFRQAGSTAKVDATLARQGFAGQSTHHVRRPVRGIQLKQETYATIQVRTADGRALPLFDAAGTIFGEDNSEENTGLTASNSNFLIQSIQEQRVEKSQIVMTFGAPYIFFFGEQPRMITVSGVLLNTADFNWRAEWWANYEQYLRGTACVRSRTRVYLSWDDIIVEGYMMTANAVDEASNINVVQFQFQMFLTNYQNISNIGDPTAHLAAEINLNPDQIDFMTSLGSGQSTTLAVREENILLASRLSAGFGSNSLLAGLRNASINVSLSAGTGRLLEVDGRVIDFLAEAGRYVSGRNIRVPVGFEGSAVFDDAQIALASISGLEDSGAAASVITGASRTVNIRRELAGRPFNIQGVLGATSSPARYGGLYLNEDEFVARFVPGLTGKAAPPELYRDQTLKSQQAGDRVRDAFRAFGVDVEPPSELRIWAAKALFGIASVAVGSLFNEVRRESGTARFVANLL